MMNCHENYRQGQTDQVVYKRIKVEDNTFISNLKTTEASSTKKKELTVYRSKKNPEKQNDVLYGHVCETSISMI